MFGVAIASSSPAVAARCAHARAGAGAVATQNITDPSLGRASSRRWRVGRHAGSTRGALAATPFGAYRQLLAVAGEDPPRHPLGGARTGDRRHGHRHATPLPPEICWRGPTFPAP
jgi:hypothetical protein